MDIYYIIDTGILYIDIYYMDGFLHSCMSVCMHVNLMSEKA